MGPVLSILVSLPLLFAAQPADPNSAPTDLTTRTADAPPPPPPPPQAPVPAPPGDLRLVFFDPSHLIAPGSAVAIADEIREATGRLDVTWRTAGPDDVATQDDLQVIFLGLDRSGIFHDGTMGATHREPGAARAVWVFVPPILRLLGMRPGSESPRDRMLLSRAIGRVVVHELVHVVAPDLAHADKGLMAARVGRKTLLDRSVRLDLRSVAALKGQAPVARGLVPTRTVSEPGFELLPF